MPPLSLLDSAGPRYVAVGGACAGLHLAVMVGGGLAGLHWLPASILSFGIVVCAGYLLHARFTFRRPPQWASFGAYALSMAANWPLSAAILFILCDLMGLAVALAAPIGTALLFGWNFAASRWSFSRR